MKIVWMVLFGFFVITGCEAADRAVQALRYGEPAPDYANYDRGVAYAMKGDFLKAQREFKKIKKTNRLYNAATSSNAVIQDVVSNAKLKKVVMQFFKANYHEHNKNYSLAIKELDKCIKINPRYAKVHVHQGDLYLLTGKKDKALASFNKAIKLNPKDSDAYYSRGLIYKETKKNNLALSDFSKSLRLSKNPDVYMNRSLIYADQGQYAKAAADAEMMAKLDPSNRVAYNILGYINVSRNNKAQACANYRKACSLGSCYDLERYQQSGYCR